MKSHLRITIETLLAKGASQHEIHRRTGIDRKTIRRHQSNSPMATGSEPGDGQIPPPRPPAPPKHAASACEPHRAWIEEQVQLGRNAQAIYQDLVERFGFEHRYNSVKRFVRGLKVREPERFDVNLDDGLRLFDLHLSYAPRVGETRVDRIGATGRRRLDGLGNSSASGAAF